VTEPMTWPPKMPSRAPPITIRSESFCSAKLISDSAKDSPTRTVEPAFDVVLVVREEMPDGHPGRAAYQQLLVNRREEWISWAVGALADRGVEQHRD
jgi:hypothetical protein